jgi:hypothetical protein
MVIHMRRKIHSGRSQCETERWETESQLT